ncbi:hypothetical protein FIBSPDRAFT_849001 [Athelia psychrophila]|uniref:G domain-containing protein n=1 Tax=Athelia psychrophila TaxID=1759441 RepID=A0A166UU71_9AGAM|nr:hypothetical protein FIBSPDRAFT_849001 [Fibularhizoctonia sp. CBS 109695]
MTKNKTRVMGYSGSGKSTFIAEASGTGHSNIHHGVANGSTSIIRTDCGKHSLAHGSAPIAFVETPSLLDDDSEDFNNLTSVVEWMKKNIVDGELAGIIFLHKISDNRMTGTHVKTLGTFAGLCGPEVMKNVIIATTMWEAGVPEERAQERLSELIQDWFCDLIEKGGKVEIFRQNLTSAWQIINYILKQTPCAPLQGVAAAKRGFFSRVFGRKN